MRLSPHHTLPLSALVIALLSPSCDRDAETRALSLSPPHDSPVGIYMDPTRIAELPVRGASWDAVQKAANAPLDRISVADGNSKANVRVLAKALVYCRTVDDAYRDQVIRACEEVIGTEGNRALDLGRELPAYVFAADLVGLPPVLENRFGAWLDRLRDFELEGGSLVSVHEGRPNNWGTHCGAARLAIAAYLDDLAEVGRVARVFQGWLGRTDLHDRFVFGGDRSWHADSRHLVGINPAGSTKDGRNVDGVLPDDQRRGGPFRWPPPRENYVYEALQGALVQAIILDRYGYDVWEWEERALLRAFEWLHDQASFPAQGDDTWQPHLINDVYGSDFPVCVPSSPGKNFGWTDWTHSR